MDSLELEVLKQVFRFNAAHFIAYVQKDGQVWREPLHGHNYSVSVKAFGIQKDSGPYVIDFGVLSQAVKKICDQLNSRMLVPMLSEALKITETPDDHLDL